MRGNLLCITAIACLGASMSDAVATEALEDLILKSREVEVRLAPESVSAGARGEADAWARSPVFVQTLATYAEPRELPRTKGVKVEDTAGAYGWQYKSSADTWLFDCSSTLAQHVETTYFDPGAHFKVARYSSFDEYGPAGRIFQVQPDTTVAVIRERACAAAAASEKNE